MLVEQVAERSSVTVIAGMPDAAKLLETPTFSRAAWCTATTFVGAGAAVLPHASSSAWRVWSRKRVRGRYRAGQRSRMGEGKGAVWREQHGRAFATSTISRGPLQPEGGDHVGAPSVEGLAARVLSIVVPGSSWDAASCTSRKAARDS
jgi:hypothetical protein